MPRIKSVAINFQIPATVDTPSETLAKMKGLLLEALSQEFHRDTTFSINLSHDERELCKALLTES